MRFAFLLSLFLVSCGKQQFSTAPSTKVQNQEQKSQSSSLKEFSSSSLSKENSPALEKINENSSKSPIDVGGAIDILGGFLKSKNSSSASLSSNTLSSSSSSLSSNSFLAITCAMEDELEEISLNGDVSMSFEEVCSKNDKISILRPLDLVFNLDRSTSMEPYLKTVRDNIKELSQKLFDLGFDVRFGAVGYVDDVTTVVSLTQISDFIENKIMEFTTQDLGNRDIQEGGLESILTSLDILKQGRNNSLKVLLHVSDAISFYKEKENFDVKEVASVMKNFSKSFAFYDSLPSEIATYGLPAALASQKLKVTIRSQMENLRKESKVAGESLAFPLTKDVFLNHLLDSLKETISYSNDCKISKVLVDGKNMGLNLNLSYKEGKKLEIVRECKDIKQKEFLLKWK